MRRAVLTALLCLGALAATATGALAFTTFATPSRNIGCAGDRTEIRCDIRTTTATFPKKRPADCDGVWGDAVSVRPTGRGTGVCHGDTALPAPGQKVRILKYGTSIHVGKITCTSRETGLTCTNPGAHGFFLSREKIRLF